MADGAPTAEWDEARFEAVLERLKAQGNINARGMRISSERLERIRQSAPEDPDRSGRPLLKYANFEGAIFEGVALFHGTTFSGYASFFGATFLGDASFDRASFSDAVRFGGATFSGDARFRRATFEGVALFNGATFEGNAHFDEATFQGYAWFRGATFQGNADFNGASFSRDAQFGDATFKGDAWFRGATFQRTARFGASFSRDAQFGEASFKGDSWFDRLDDELKEDQRPFFDPLKSSPSYSSAAAVLAGFCFAAIVLLFNLQERAPGQFDRAVTALLTAFLGLILSAFLMALVAGQKCRSTRSLWLATLASIALATSALFALWGLAEVVGAVFHREPAVIKAAGAPELNDCHGVLVALDTPLSKLPDLAERKQLCVVLRPNAPLLEGRNLKLNDCHRRLLPADTPLSELPDRAKRKELCLELRREGDGGLSGIVVWVFIVASVMVAFFVVTTGVDLRCRYGAKHLGEEALGLVVGQAAMALVAIVAYKIGVSLDVSGKTLLYGIAYLELLALTVLVVAALLLSSPVRVPGRLGYLFVAISPASATGFLVALPAGFAAFLYSLLP